MRHLARAALAVGLVIALGGCGSSSSSGGGSDEASKSADQIFSDLVAAMKQVDHVHITGTQTDDSGTAQLTGDVTQTSARVEVKANGNDTVFIVTGGKAYGSQNGGPFSELPADLTVQVSVATLAKTIECAQSEHGTLAKGEVSTLNGVRVIALTDDGKAPGASPSTAFITLDGPARLIETRQTGRTTPGGRADCGHSSTDTTTAQQSDFDYSGPTPTITPPV